MIRSVIFLFIIYCFFGSLSAQDSLAFPQSWQGIWKGDLAIYTSAGLAQEVPMQLHILPTDSVHRYTWSIIYGTDTIAGKRDYDLLIVDAEKGLYRVDEKNSIQLESYFIKDKLFSRFEVMDNLLLTTEQLVGDTLIFEIISGKLAPVSSTGNEVIEGDTIPPVETFPIRVMQRALLSRQ
ncbi:MAG: hypothetical protein AAF705_13975 [Bacteroidota bacterium]